MNMREKIARAIYAKRNGVGSAPWGNRPDTHKHPYLVDADAALDALIDATPEMIRALRPDMDYEEVYTAMIRAAKEGK